MMKDARFLRANHPCPLLEKRRGTLRELLHQQERKLRIAFLNLRILLPFLQ
jgi:hypothetical protein